MSTKYFLYARKSSESEERQVMSIEAQLVEMNEFARKENLTILETFVESKSAKSPGRTEFGRMIEKIKDSREPIGIMAWHPDRLARNSIDGGQIIYLIDTKQICALKFPTFWFEATPQGLFMLQMAFGQSKYYSDNLSENVKRGIRQKLRRGEWIVSAPLGYVNNPKTRNIEPDPVKGRIVKQLFSDYAKGKFSMNGAREWLQLLGVESKGRIPKSQSSVEKVLTNPVYYGVIRVKGEYYEGKFEPLITKETFDAVQTRMKDRSQPRKGRKGHDFGFMGLFKCGECGCAITAQFAKGNGGTYRYYRCSKKKVKCSQGYLREDLVKSQLLEEIKKISIPDGWGTEMLTEIDKIVRDRQRGLILFAQNLEGQIIETEAKLDKLINAFLEEVIGKDDYLKKKEALINQKQTLRDKKAAFGQKGLLWVEPLQDFVKAADCAGKLNSTSEISEIKAIIEKSGTNRLLRGKKICFDLVEPFSYVNENKGSGAMEKNSRPKKENGKSVKKTDLPLWWRISESNR